MRRVTALLGAMLLALVAPGGAATATSSSNSFDLDLTEPEYPICEATPDVAYPGDTILLRAWLLGPTGAPVHLLLGNLTIGLGEVDTQGAVVEYVTIPSDAATGLRLLTVSVDGTALAADCSIVLEPTTVPVFVPADGPSLTLEQDAGPRRYRATGINIDYIYHLTNTGEVDLAGPVTFTSNAGDPSEAGVPLACPAISSVGNHDDVLDPGETLTCTGQHTVTQGDLDAGSFTNEVVAHARNGESTVDSNGQLFTSLAQQRPALTLGKTSGTEAFSAAGDRIDYSYQLTNSGNVTLAAPYTVEDDRIASVDCPKVPANIAPGASVTCTASYDVTLADADAGSVTNTATGHAMFDDAPVDSNPASLTVDAAQNPQLTLKLTVTETSYADTSDTLNYSYKLTNSGNVTLDKPYTVTDDKVASVDCPSAPADLAPGDSVTCTGTYSVAQADIDAGSVANTATGHAYFSETTIDSNSDSVTAYAAQNPQLTLKKTTSTASYASTSDVINYSYKLTNSGNVTLSSPYTVTDDKVASVDCPSAPASLAPGDSVTCIGTYGVKQADIGAGSVTNTATGHAKRSGSTIDSNADSVTVDASQPVAQSIDFGPLADATYGDPPLTLSATATSGLAVTFGSDTPDVCSISGTTVTIRAAGLCTVRASQGGDATHDPADDAIQSFTVRQATPTVTVSGGPFTFDATQHAATVTVKGAGGAAVGGSSVVTYTPGGSTAPTGAGTYTVAAAFTSTDLNYKDAAGSGSITIGPAATSVLYTGDQSVTIPNAFNLAAQRTGPAACPISYALDPNPLTGAAGPYALGSGGAVPTTKWLEGAYTLTVTLGGDANCLASTDQTTLAVSSAGDTALGAGSYTLTDAGRVTFAFTVLQVPKKTPIQYTGMFTLVNSGKWWITGNLSTYTKLNSTGTATGAGKLYWWNQSLNKGHGGWALATSKATYTITFTGSTSKAKGSFGIQITFKPTAPQPRALPNSAPTVLRAGVIKMK